MPAIFITHMIAQFIRQKNKEKGTLELVHLRVHFVGDNDKTIHICVIYRAASEKGLNKVPLRTYFQEACLPTESILEILSHLRPTVALFSCQTKAILYQLNITML